MAGTSAYGSTQVAPSAHGTTVAAPGFVAPGMAGTPAIVAAPGPSASGAAASLGTTGLVTTSILFCCLIRIKDQREKSVF